MGVPCHKEEADFCGTLGVPGFLKPQFCLQKFVPGILALSLLWELSPKTSILCLVLLDSSNLDRTSLPDAEKTQNTLIFLVATLLI